ncbi:rRNA maturation RNase YbeY [Candidatus Marithrix sp. Canyon 246]|uniref:rRNA maturation RNase YbeY n=1 Tax=Candidatus Marithrix sp. Canyon 246 TaxID=1827136 RepID=UPI00084A2593|nr:rRNA maturation RNase YbeY [Candidatus Marithrix sp. Canyon 246]
MKADIDIQYVSKAADLPNSEMINAWVNAALQSIDEPNPELTIRIVDEVEAQELNEKWRQRSYPTNVLSFPFESPPGINIPLLGDIIICAAVVKHEAAEQQKYVESHWAHMIIHGCLHLLGYDHISDYEANIMENLEIDILHSLGYSNPYL